MNTLIKNITEQFYEIQEGENWLDENFKKKIDSLTEGQALTRPIPDIHSVAELVSHLIVWRQDTLKKLKGLEADLSVDSPQNWRNNEELKKIGWNNLKNEFYASTREITELIKDKSDQYLDHMYQNKYSYKALIEGLVHHDLYHLGQIGITIKLLKKM